MVNLIKKNKIQCLLLKSLQNVASDADNAFWTKYDKSNETNTYVNDTNKISVINTNDWVLSKEIFDVKKPSGIFIYRETK